MEPTDVTFFETPGAFRAWLSTHHDEVDVLWVGYWKTATGRASMTWQESVDEALCFGWIDGLRKRLDDDAYTIRFTPRRSGSTWSSRNVERAEALRRAGRMRPPGEAAYAACMDDRTGIYSFERDDPVALPADYEARIRKDTAAWADWQARPPGYRRTVAHWIMSAKREVTRERRLAALIEDSAAGRKVKPLR